MGDIHFDQIEEKDIANIEEAKAHIEVFFSGLFAKHWAITPVDFLPIALAPALYLTFAD